MNEALRDAVAHYTTCCADADGIAQTPIPGFSAICAPSPSELVFAISRPLVALVLQGQKTVATGARQFRLNAGDSMLITADVPTLSQITQANIATPYLSLVLNLDLAVVTELAICNHSERTDEAALIRIENTDTEVADTALRLMRLLDRPRSLPILQAQTVRELHHWLLAGRHGAALRGIGGVQGNIQRIARAVALLRSEFAQPLPIERLAAAAGMSASSFHQHFRRVTSLSPLQFQKQLRLIEARRLMVADGVAASIAAFAVGYESPSQFTREYSRMFGMPPVRDVTSLRSHAAVDI